MLFLTFDFGGWGIPGGAEDLFLNLLSGITPGSLGEPHEILGVKPRLSTYKTNTPPATLSF